MDKKYYLKLDLIRIISCILIIFYHLNILNGGFLAVCTFFVLSGYLECISALKNDNFSIISYYKKRFIRIYIPLLIVVCLTVIVFYLIPGLTWINLKQETTSTLLGYNNFWQLSANLNYFTKNINSPLTHLWYISILLQFDLIFPLIFKLFKKINNNILTIFFFALAVISTLLFYFIGNQNDIMVLYYNTFLRLFSFLWGIFLALMQCNYDNRLSNKFLNIGNGIYIMYLLLLILMCIFIPNESYYSLIMIISTLISCRLIEYSTIKNNNNKLINKISSITYELYLTHYPIIFFVQKFNINYILSIILIIILSIIISIIIHNLVNLIKNNKFIYYTKIIIIIIISIIGIYFIVVAKDYANEINELENIINEKQQEIDERNKYNNNLENYNENNNNIIENNLSDEEIVQKQLSEMQIVGIGDSVFLNAIDLLYEKFPNGYFDGKVSRPLSIGINILTDLKNEGKLPNNIILALANNGDYREKKNKQLMELVEDREVYWINAVGADDPNFNKRFEEFAKDYPNIHIIDWEKEANGHPEYFYYDGIHPRPNAINVYVDLIYNTIYNYNLNLYKKNN